MIKYTLGKPLNVALRSDKNGETEVLLNWIGPVDAVVKFDFHKNRRLALAKVSLKISLIKPTKMCILIIWLRLIFK